MTADQNKSDAKSSASEPPKSQGNMPSIVQSQTMRTTVAGKWVFISRN
jgi:hypothetical protein